MCNNGQKMKAIIIQWLQLEPDLQEFEVKNVKQG